MEVLKDLARVGLCLTLTLATAHSFAETLPAASATRSPASTSDSSTTISGFADVGYSWIDEDSFNSGFRLFAGSLMVEHKFQDSRFYLDLPIKWAGPLDTDNDGIADSAATNNFDLAKEKAQLYLEHKVGEWTLTLGQFDSIYGYEANDAADNFFARLAWVGINVSHGTHNGLMLAHQRGPWSLNLIASDAVGKGSLGNTSPEYGGMIGYTQENGYLKFGYIEYSDHGDPMRFSEILMGLMRDHWELHLELDHVDQVGQQDDTQAFLVSFTSQANDKWAWGLRFEGTSDYPGTYRRMDQTAGLKRTVNDHLVVKLDYRHSKSQSTQGATESKEDSAALSAVYRF